MLDVIGVSSVDDLFAEIRPELKPKSFKLPQGKSEMAVMAELDALSRKNATHLVSFLGAGFYDHHIPAAVDALTSRGEFYTAYTPYQPEASQGTLQAIFEFQTAISRLMELPCVNAGVYDGGSALFEAAMMAVRHTRRRKLIICGAVNPIYQTMFASYTSNLNLDMVTVPALNGATDTGAITAALDQNTAAVLVQNPNFFGSIEDYTDLFAAVKGVGAVGVISVYPVLQSVLKTPGRMGADIAVAEGQSLGLPLSFGGPYLGLMACSKTMVRQLPGRIVGRTLDRQGRTGYVLTLQAREQHIRRQKATSNICSNQALCALRALIHLCLLGEEGLARTAGLCIEKAHKAARRITAIPGVELLSDRPFGNEFAVNLPKSSYEVIDRITARGYVPGFPLGRYYPGLENGLLVACTEKTSDEDIGILAEMLRGSLS
jgi:glycine dehydrogenase subunit 1